MSESLNLSKLKDEIRKKKSERNQNINGNNHNKDSFLNELVMSLETGQQTNAINIIKEVSNETAIKKNEKPVFNTELKKSTNTLKNVNKVNNVEERDDLLYEEFERKKRELKDRMSSYPQTQSITNQQVVLNEDVVKKVIDENFKHLIEDGLKNAIIDIFVNERIREFLNENEDYLEKMIISTLTKLKKKTTKRK